MNASKKPSNPRLRILRPFEVEPPEVDPDARITDVVGHFPNGHAYTAAPKREYELFPIRAFREGEIIVDFFESLPGCLVLLEGSAVEETYASSGAIETPLRDLQLGDVIGAEALEDLSRGTESQSRYRAMTDVVAYEIDMDTIERTREPQLRLARTRYLLEKLGRHAQTMQALGRELLGDRLELHDARRLLEQAESERAEAVAKAAELKTYCDRFVQSDAVQTIVHLRADRDRLLDERRREAISLQSVLGTQLELNRQMDEELEALRQKRDDFYQALIHVESQICELQSSRDPQKQKLGVYILGVLHGLKMRAV